MLAETKAGRRNLSAYELLLCTKAMMVEPNYFFQDLSSSLPDTWIGSRDMQLGKTDL